MSVRPAHSLDDLTPEKFSFSLHSDQLSSRSPIAIIGLGCRFPFASDPETFWQLLCEGRDAITEVPPDRFDVTACYDPRPATPGKMVTRWGGFLEQIDGFDAFFFGISPREAERMDPQQRLLLEVAWEALADAGQVPAALAGQPVGVFIGMCSNDYEDLQITDPQTVDLYTNTGGARSVASGRISYALSLEGPSLTVDTACSSSLVAVHLACQSLWSGESVMALAGGVNLILLPEFTIGFSQANMLAPDGRCKFADARANGFVRSEGAGVVVLKPLDRALADGDPIYAVIRGSAVNNDGRSSGHLMTPGVGGQEAVLRAAYRYAGVAPGQVHYVEAHGTGTSAGDPVEMRALGAVLGEGRPADRPCRVGSVKSNIGHTEGAAGIAGLIKTALALKHRLIPPSLHVQTLNPDIPWGELPLVVQQELEPWPVVDEPALAGVSSFGISGTNAHVVLQEAPSVESTAPKAARASREFLLPLSAKNPAALKELIRAYVAFLTSENAEPMLQDICYTACVRRPHYEYRRAFVATTREALIAQLTAEMQQVEMSGDPVDVTRDPQVVFVFSGQGSQWVGMGRELLTQEPVFRETLERCDRAIREYADWSLLEILTSDAEENALEEVDVVQPALFAMQVGLAALWRSWGIEPAAVVGQSMGEVAAAHVAGALRLEDAVQVICQRSQLVKRRASGQGGMAVVGLALAEAQQAVAGYADRVAVAVSSSPFSTVLSGDAEALEAVLAELQRQDVFCRRIKVDYASHSPHMDPLRSDLLRLLQDLSPQPAGVPMYSTVTKGIVEGQTLDATYWVRNLREPVLFWPAIQQLVADGHTIFLEISPHPVLLGAIQQGLQHLGCEGLALSSLRNGESERVALLETIGTLYETGYPLDWRRLYPEGGQCVRLPAYPWQREHFWRDDLAQSGDRRRRTLFSRRQGDDATGHPLLTVRMDSAAHAGTHFWEMALSTAALPYLGDHRVRGNPVLPAAAYLELAFSAAQKLFGSTALALEKVAFEEAFFVPEERPKEAQLVVAEGWPGTASFKFFGLEAGDEGSDGTWTLHATGRIRVLPADRPENRREGAVIEIQARCEEEMTGPDHYEALEARGLTYGPGFQGVVQLWRRDGEAIGQIRLPATVAPEAERYGVHPVLLDAGFQVLAAALPFDIAGVADTYLPVALRTLRVYDQPAGELWAHAMVQKDQEDPGTVVEGDVFLLDQAGQVVVEALGLRFQRLERRSQQSVTDWFYEVRWEEQPLPTPPVLPDPSAAEASGGWLILADQGGVGEALAAQLEAHGETCVLVKAGPTYQAVGARHFQLDPACPEHFRRLLSEAWGPVGQPPRGVIHLGSLDVPPETEWTPTHLDEALVFGCGSVLHLVQALTGAGWDEAPRLWLVTRGAQRVTADDRVRVAQAPLWGLARVIGYEHPELQCVRIDLSEAGGEAEIQALFQELWVTAREDEVALRGEQRWVARFVRAPKGAEPASPEATDSREEISVSFGTTPYRLEIAEPGILDRLVLRTTSRRELAPGEVEIQVYATGLNFSDVMKAMGIYPGLPDGPVPLGIECAGRICAIGAGVTDFQVGDAVVAMAPFCFGAYVTTPAHHVWHKPAHLSFEEAATLPIAFLTAHYALNYLGRMEAGERVLIHAASGGVGLAAVQLAQRAGAEIFATAGSPEKRAFLRSLGIQHVMDSRSLAFAEEILDKTGGEGVDLVLNSLAGEAIAAGMEVLRPYGRFLELGKRDIYQDSQIGLKPFQKNLAFFAIDLDRAARERPALVGSLFREMVQAVESRTLASLPHQVFPISEVVEAFRHMAQAKHIGKVVVSLEEPIVRVAPAGEEPLNFKADGSYLITGGLGGLGLTVARWMVENGARHLVLTGRRGAVGPAVEAVEALREKGVAVAVMQADAADGEAMAGVLAEIQRTMPPLRGVIHAAGLLDDGILQQQTLDRFRAVMAPKVLGAWHLHRLTHQMALDFFVLFSSAASLFGSPGQGNYSAANAFLDALAHHRRARGLPALSINWGPWSEVGLAAAQANRGERLAERGFGSLSPRQGIEALARLLRRSPTQVGVVPFDYPQWCAFYPAAAGASLFSRLAAEYEEAGSPAGKDDGIRDALLAVEAGPRRRALLEEHLREQVAQVLRLPTARIDPARPLDAYGLDSLMAMELKNRMESSLGVGLSATVVWNYPTISALASHLAQKAGIPLAATATDAEPASLQDDLPDPQDLEELVQLLEDVEQLSDEEVRRLLAEDADMEDI